MLKNSPKESSKAANKFIKAGPDAMSSQGLMKKENEKLDTTQNHSDLKEGQRAASNIAPKKHELADDALQPGQQDVIKSAVCSKVEDNQPMDLEKGMVKQIDQQKIDEDLLHK